MQPYRHAPRLCPRPSEIRLCPGGCGILDSSRVPNRCSQRPWRLSSYRGWHRIFLVPNWDMKLQATSTILPILTIIFSTRYYVGQTPSLYAKARIRGHTWSGNCGARQNDKRILPMFAVNVSTCKVQPVIDSVVFRCSCRSLQHGS